MKRSVAIAFSALHCTAAFTRPSKGSSSHSTSTQLSMSTYSSYHDRDRVNVDYNMDSAPLALSRPRGTARSLAEIWKNSAPVIVQGSSLRTWSFANPALDDVQVLLKTEGRLLDADVELWNGPDNTPHKMQVNVEDGALRTFNAVIGTPRGPNTIAVRNIGQLEFSLDAVVRPDREDGLAIDIASVSSRYSETIQGGDLCTYPFNAVIQSVTIILKTDGRPPNARIELLQGPNSNKQVVDLNTEDDLDHPFFAIVETPGAGNVIRVVNTAPLEFPLYASLDAYEISGRSWDGSDGYMIGQWPRL